MNKLIIAIIVIAAVVVVGLLYFNLNDSGGGEAGTESVLPPAEESPSGQFPTAESFDSTLPPAGESNQPVKTSIPPPTPSVNSGQAPPVIPPAATPPPAPKPTTHQVSIQGFAFSQSSINVKKGDTVVWANNDSAPHTVTADSGASGPASQTLNGGNTYSFTFTSAGTFKYHCAFHPGMTGTVLVTE